MNSEELQEAYSDHKTEKVEVKNTMHWEAPEGVPEWTDEEMLAHLSDLILDQYPELLDHLGNTIHPTNVEKGFWDEPVMMDKYAAKMMLVVTETAEVIEALRKSQGADKVTEEFSDILIRMLDLYVTLVQAGEADPNLLKVTMEKMETNKNRPPKHGNRWG